MTATSAPSFLASGRGKLTLALLTATGFSAVTGWLVLAATAFGLPTRNSRGEQGAEPIVVQPELCAVET